MDESLLQIVLPVAGLVVGILIAVLLVRRWGDRESSELLVPEDPALDVRTREPRDPPADGVRLEVYGIPLRLEALVLAPVGRGSVIDQTQLPQIVEQLVPDFYSLLSSHQPQFRLWEPQLSGSGFQTQFFKQLHLPGNRGKNTPWAAICGRFSADGRPLMAGLVFCSERPNGLGQMTVQHEGQWLDILRLKHDTGQASRDAT